MRKIQGECLTKKAERLIRYHRQHAFDERSGDMHTRAIIRIKTTKIWQDISRKNRDNEEYRKSEMLLRMYA